MERTELCRKIGASIRKHRLSVDMSQENLSLSAGLHSAYIGRLERGEKCPTVDTLYKISDALGVSVFDLLSDNKAESVSGDALRSIEESLAKISIEKQHDVARIISSITEMIV